MAGLTTLLAAALGTGCASSDAADGHADPRANGSKAAAAAAHGGLVLAPAKHNGSGVELRYAPPPAVKSGDTATVQLQFSNVTAAEGAQVELRPGDAQTQVSINGAAVAGPIALATGVTQSLEVQVSASEDGMHYLNIFTRQAGRSTAQSIGLKFGSGQPQLKSNGTVTTTPSGERVISLPAR